MDTRYILSGEGANDIFSVNDNGDIFVNAMLDREKKSTYMLSASIININNRKLMDNDEKFVIVVLDINDNIPVFPPDVSGSISESSIAGNRVSYVLFFTWWPYSM